MNIITFPKSEWGDIKGRFNAGKIVYTLRVDDEYGQYKDYDLLETEWGLKVKILSVKKVAGGIDELRNNYEFFGELAEETIRQLANYDRFEIVAIKAI